jgi:hypothetical protein
LAQLAAVELLPSQIRRRMSLIAAMQIAISAAADRTDHRHTFSSRTKRLMLCHGCSITLMKNRAQLPTFAG